MAAQTLYNYFSSHPFHNPQQLTHLELLGALAGILDEHAREHLQQQLALAVLGEVFRRLGQAQQVKANTQGW